jgi:hypothetical protein
MSKIPAQILLTDEEGNKRWTVNINAFTEKELKDESINFLYEENISEELGWISDMLEWSEDLAPEVIQFALLSMKRNPTLSPAQAMKSGYDEWIK